MKSYEIAENATGAGDGRTISAKTKKYVPPYGGGMVREMAGNMARSPSESARFSRGSIVMEAPQPSRSGTTTVALQQDMLQKTEAVLRTTHVRKLCIERLASNSATGTSEPPASRAGPPHPSMIGGRRRQAERCLRVSEYHTAFANMRRAVSEYFRTSKLRLDMYTYFDQVATPTQELLILDIVQSFIGINIPTGMQFRLCSKK